MAWLRRLTDSEKVAPSWSDLVAETAGIEDFGSIPVRVTSAVELTPGQSVIVQVYARCPLSDLSDLEYVRPISASVQPMPQCGGTDVSFRAFLAGARSGDLVVAWLTSDQSDTEFGGLTEIPPPNALVSRLGEMPVLTLCFPDDGKMSAAA